MPAVSPRLNAPASRDAGKRINESNRMYTLLSRERRRRHELLEQTRANLQTWNLMRLFEVFPIPPEAQEVFNRLCDIGNAIPLDGTVERLTFLLYIEKALELFQQMESLGVKLPIPEGSREPIIYNTFQLSILGLVKKDDRNTYLVSTGYWREHNKRRPGIFKIFGPCSMTNCAGNFTVSMGLRILTSSGQFYEAPMALDHTLRYPQDYELHEPCRERPGWLPVTLPPDLRNVWDTVQDYQLQTTRLRSIIEQTIKKANDPSQRLFAPTGNIDGFWDA